MNIRVNKTALISAILFLQIFFNSGNRFFCFQNLYGQVLHHNPWDLIIYRPENSSQINDIRCWIKIEDENGNDVTYSAIRKATYEWASIPNVVNQYKHTYFLSGGMAMHINIKPGKYKISVYTPEDKHQFPEYDYDNKGDWTSNIFEYDTDNPAKVIFVYPSTNENGFYNGGWIIDYKSPKYFKFTIPKVDNSL